jgi:hypothetical protein
MACPNFKKGLKMAFGSLGVKKSYSNPWMFSATKGSKSTKYILIAS